MKNILFTSFAVFLSAALTTSCDRLGITAPKMDSEEATGIIIETLNKNIDFDDWKIYEVRWMEGEELENDLTVLSVYMVNKSGDCFYQDFTLSGPGKGHVSDLRKAIGTSKVDFEQVNGITPDMIDPAAIQQQYESAQSMVPEEYTFKSIANYTIEEDIPSGNPFLDKRKSFGVAKASFEINVTEDGKEIVESAGKKSIQYYQILFNVQPDGSIEMDE